MLGPQCAGSAASGGPGPEADQRLRTRPRGPAGGGSGRVRRVAGARHPLLALSPPSRPALPAPPPGAGPRVPSPPLGTPPAPSRAPGAGLRRRTAKGSALLRTAGRGRARPPAALPAPSAFPAAGGASRVLGSPRAPRRPLRSPTRAVRWRLSPSRRHSSLPKLAWPPALCTGVSERAHPCVQGRMCARVPLTHVVPPPVCVQTQNCHPRARRGVDPLSLPPHSPVDRCCVWEPWEQSSNPRSGGFCSPPHPGPAAGRALCPPPAALPRLQPRGGAEPCFLGRHVGPRPVYPDHMHTERVGACVYTLTLGCSARETEGMFPAPRPEGFPEDRGPGGLRAWALGVEDNRPQEPEMGFPRRFQGLGEGQWRARGSPWRRQPCKGPVAGEHGGVRTRQAPEGRATSRTHGAAPDLSVLRASGHVLEGWGHGGVCNGGAGGG